MFLILFILAMNLNIADIPQKMNSNLSKCSPTIESQ